MPSSGLRFAPFAVTLCALAIARESQAATITFDDIVFGQTSYGYDGDGDGIDDVIFTTPDPSGFNTVGPGTNQNYIHEPGIEGTAQIPESLRVDFEIGAIGAIQFGFALCTESQTSGVVFKVYDANDNLLSETFTLGTKDPTPAGVSSFPEGLVQATFPGRAQYATFTFTNDSTNDPQTCGRYIIDDLTGVFGSSEVIDENPPECSFDVASAVSHASGSASDDRPSEDLDGDGFLDPGEDLNDNGKIDTDFGIQSVELADISSNVTLTTSLVAGDATTDFSVDLIDGNAPGSATVFVTDLVGNVCSASVELTGCVPAAAPVITVSDGEDTLTCGGGEWTDAGASAVDACGVALSVTTTGTVDAGTAGSYVITYAATDRLGHMGSVERVVAVVDDTAPTLVLAGDASQALTCPALYVEAGASATDACDEDLEVVITGSVNADVAGDYPVTYTVTDTSGNQATATRTVSVAGAAIDCDDSNPCTDEVCVRGAGGGCTNPANVLPCDDGNACTTGDTCADSACVGSDTSQRDCDDLRACTSDSCVAASGCVHDVVMAGTICGAYRCDGSSGDCPTQCDADSDCATGNYCDAEGLCVPTEDNGDPCGRSAMCTSAQCVDGVCCDVACDGACAACDVSGHVGTCAPVADGTPSSCAPYLCDGVALDCPGQCSADSDCTSGSYCDATGRCVPTEDNGDPCGRTAMCTSAQCVDGVCCDVACQGACQACDVVGHAGTCTALAEGTASSCARYLCDGVSGDCPIGCDEDSDCVAGNYCDADGVCRTLGDDGDACGRDGACASGVCASGGICCDRVCEGACESCGNAASEGTCGPVLAGTASSCAPYLCDGVAGDCPESCGSDADCVAGTYCDDDGACVDVVDDGSECTRDRQCTSGFCADGTCISLTIDEPSDGALLADATPTIAGQAPPGATVTVSLGDARVEVTADESGHWSYTPEDALADGELTISASYDEHEVSVTVTIDTMAPPLTISEPTSGSTRASADVTIGGTSEPGARVTITLGDETVTVTADANGAWSHTFTELDEGAHTATVEASDAAGNSSEASVSFTVDTTAPAVIIETPTDGVYLASGDVTVAGHADADVALTGIGTIAAPLSAGAFSHAYTGLADGSYTVVATATDDAGRSASDEVTFTVDTIAPVVVISTPAEVTSGEARPTITGTGEPGTTISVSVDGAVVGTATVNSDGTWSVTLDHDLGDGAHTITATSTDRAGNSGTATRTVTIDTMAPVVTIVTPAAGAQVPNDVQVTGTADAGADVVVTIDGVVVGTAVADASGGWSLTLTLALGEHLAIARETDPTGNVGSATRQFFVISVDFAARGGGGCAAGGGESLVALLLGLSVVWSSRRRARCRS